MTGDEKAVPINDPSTAQKKPLPRGRPARTDETMPGVHVL